MQGSGGTSVVWVWASMLSQVCVLQQRLPPQSHQLSPNSHAHVTPRAPRTRMIFLPPFITLLFEVWKSAPRQAGQPHTGSWRCSGQRPKLTYCLEDGERKMGDENSPDRESNWKSVPKDCPNVSHSSFSTQTVN